MARDEIRYKGAVYAVESSLVSGGGTLYETKSLMCDSLEANTLAVTVSDPSRAITRFALNDPVEYWREGDKMGTFYLQTVERVGRAFYKLTAYSAVGRLMTMLHPGGMLTGQTAGEVIREICGDLPVLVQSVYEGRKLYNWLPYCKPNPDGSGNSARDNLAQVLFVIGAWLGVDADGVLRVEKLWDGYSCTIGPGRIHVDNCSVPYTAPVSAVEVTEHQWVRTDEAVTLFDGTAEKGDVVTFDEPAYDLVGDGVTVLESNCNYARLSAGTGTVTGKKYNHITRIVRRTVTPGAAENVVAIPDTSYLVSMVSVAAVAQRLAQYYACRETISADTNPHAGPPGAVVKLWHPWDDAYVQATIAERETSISGLLKAQTQALVGYVPPQPEGSQYFTGYVLLTEDTDWVVPEGVLAIHAVICGGGQGGWSGLPGGRAPVQKVQKSTTTSGAGDSKRTITKVYVTATLGGDGGEAGASGDGGKILVVDMDVTPGQALHAAIGLGGDGGEPGDESNPGSLGGDTTFAGRSSVSGSVYPSGYYDELTKTIYAAPGNAGVAGSNGSGAEQQNGSWVSVPGATITVDGVDYVPGTDNNSSIEDERGQANLGHGYKEAIAYGSYGGGPAYGANGNNGRQPSSGNISVTNTSAYARPVDGGKGATALPPPDETIPGKGGAGGNGGGGQGSFGEAEVYSTISGNAVSADLSIGAGGSSVLPASGSRGGKGAKGFVLIYYQTEQVIPTGPLRSSDGSWLISRDGRWLIT